MEENKEKIAKLRSSLEGELSLEMRIDVLNVLRYYLSLEEKEEEKVKYDEEKDKLIYSESIEIAIVLINQIEEVIGKQEIELQQKLLEIMKSNYYYLGKYLYNYYAVALEFGIPKAKQFLAPRTCVLNYVNWELTKFYYKDRGILTISMPQGTGKTERSARDLCLGQ